MNTTSIEFTNKQLIKLVVPLLIEQFLAMAVGLADSMMVAQVGDAAVSGVSLVDSISALMIYIFTALAAGGAAVCGQYLGHTSQDNAKRAGHHLIMLMFVSSVAITLLLYIFNVPILNVLFGQADADVVAATKTYFMIVMSSVPGLALYNAGAGIFRAMGQTGITMKVSLIMNGINLAGNAILIFAFGCGVEGVAIPTVVSRWVAAIIILVLLLNKKYNLNLRGIFKFRLNKKISKNIVRFGIPSGVENGMFQLGKIVLFSYVSTLGTASITANAIGGLIASLQVIAGQAINLGMTTVVSRCVGAGEFEKAKYYFKKMFLWSLVVQAVWIGILFALMPLIMHVYGVSVEAETLAWKVSILHGVLSASLWLPAFVLPNFLRSAGDTTFTMIVSSISMWVGRVACGIILGKAFGLGLMGVWIAHTVIDWLARSIFFFVRYKKEKWKSKAIRE